MAIQRLIAIIAGKLQEYVPITQSAGASSAGAIPALNNAGTLDVTMMPSGIGPDTVVVPATEALAAGAPVNIWSNAGVFSARNADGSTTGKQMDGFVLSAVASGANATVYLSGINAAVTGLTPGLVYLGTSAGTYAGSGASNAGQTFQQVGMALSATSLQFDPQTPVVRN